MKYILIKLIKIYQKIPGPWHNSCRHIPTCSNYGIEAITEYGSIKGTFMAIKRILRCNPWGTSGYDPVKKKRRMIYMKKFLVIIFMFICFISTGCLKRDTMEDILIYTSAYPIQYITEQLYGDNATIQSIYPNGIIIDKYTLTEKQLQDYSNCDLFIFNGLSVEKNYISPMLKSNRNLKIIDASASIEYTNRIEEMWLDPSNFLMTAQNIKIGFEEYVTNQYLLKEIEDNYNKLKVQSSKLDAKTQLMIQDADNKTIVVSNDLFKYLEKYGLEVISLQGTDNSADKNLETAKTMINNKKLKYIYTLKNEDINESIQNLIKDTKVELVQFHTLSNLDDTEIKAGKDYMSIMDANIELLKQQLYN